MKLPLALNQLFHQEPQEQEFFCTLILERHRIGAAIWQVPIKKNKLDILVSDWDKVPSDSWEDRIKTIDSLLTSLEQQVPNGTITKVILGLSEDYLTADGDIYAASKKPIKMLCDETGLSPLGFVSIAQAIVYKLHHDEGVPPSVILLKIDGDALTVYLYKVGKLLTTIKLANEHIVEELEHTLKGLTDLEVLPSRILLYGEDEKLEEVKQQLLRHPWPTKVNFLHFPKIEVLPGNVPIESVSFAGASETATILIPQSTEQFIQETAIQNEIAMTHVAQPVVGGEEENVAMVDPGQLGFTRDKDIRGEEGLSRTVESKPKHSMSIPNWFSHMPKMSLPSASIFIRTRMIAFLVIILFVFLGLGGVLYWVLPRASIVAIQIPFTLEDSVAVTVDPMATAIDSDKKIIPGKKLAKPIGGEKTISVTGKKTVGTPAKGGVTIYNKSYSPKTFVKGTVIAFGSLKFTLDTEVTVASASDNLAKSTIDLGKETVGVTAITIGTQSNIAADKDFIFQDFSSNVVVARNDQPFSGGTSKDITVVTRADYDALTKSLSEELISKAKTDLSNSLPEGEKLVDDTVKASITEKSFVEELEQEAKELHGKITITVTGVSYKENDIVELLKNSMSSRVPSGFVFAPEKTTVSLEKINVKKDSAITLSAKIKGMALPSWDIAAIQKSLAGKSLEAAKQYLSTISGLGSVEFHFQWSIGKNKLPANPKNISIVTNQ